MLNEHQMMIVGEMHPRALVLTLVALVVSVTAQLHTSTLAVKYFDKYFG